MEYYSTIKKLPDPLPERKAGMTAEEIKELSDISERVVGPLYKLNVVDQ